MIRFARIAMLVSWTALSVSVLVLLVVGAVWEPEALFDFLDLPLDLPPAPVWVVVLLAMSSLVTMASLGLVFWRFHRVLGCARLNDFDGLACQLKGAGTALMAFWAAFQITDRVMPVLMLLDHPDLMWEEFDPFLIDLDLIFLVLGGIVFWALARSLARAARSTMKIGIFCEALRWRSASTSTSCWSNARCRRANWRRPSGCPRQTCRCSNPGK